MGQGDTSVIRPDRRREEHAGRTTALNRAILLCVACFVGGFAALFALTRAGVSQEGAAGQRLTWGIALVIGGSIVYALWTYVRILIYRCPRCGGRTVVVDEAQPAINKYCATCNVEWVTGVSHSLD